LSRVDLHIHSTASDGKFSPEAIVSKAAKLGLTIIALSDHDSVDGVIPALEAARAFPQLRVIPSVEISTEMSAGEAHVLGYFINYTSDELRATLERFRNSRQRRAQGMITRLRDFGIHIDWQRVQEIAGDGSIGRPHIAQAMLEKGYITSFKEAFTRYIGQGGPAYVEREKMTPAEAVALIVRSGGLPVLAHPFTVNDPEATIIELKAAGLVGIEAYYNSYTADAVEKLVSLAEKHRLIATGGSDYHGLDDSNETMLGGVEVPMASAEQLISLAEERGLRLANP
jgi:predicted metal-dependent phosphoesterase TrpH